MSESATKRNKGIFYVLLVLAMFFTGCKDKQEEKNKEIAKQTLEKLKTDYNEEFEIESIKYVTQNDSYILFVHPKTEPDMSIRVVKWKMAENKLIDDYVSARRYLQTKKHFKPFAESISKKYLISAGIGGIVEKEEYWDVNYSIEDLLKKYNRDITLGIDIFYFFDLNENNTEEVCKKVYEMVKYIQDLNVGQVNISIQFYDEEFFKDKDVVKINEEEMGPAGMMNFQFHYGKYELSTLNIGKDKGFKLNEIKSYKDIENKIWYKKFTGEKDNIGEENYKWIQK